MEGASTLDARCHETGASVETARPRGVVEVETVADAAGFAALADGWDDLVAGMPRPSPFMLHAWLDEWWRVNIGGDARLAVVSARRDGRLVGALPLMIGRTRAARGDVHRRA